LEVGKYRLEVGWRSVGGRLEVGKYRLEVGKYRLEVGWRSVGVHGRSRGKGRVCQTRQLKDIKPIKGRIVETRLN